MNFFRSVLFLCFFLTGHVLAGPCDANCSGATRGFLNFLLGAPRFIVAKFGNRRTLQQDEVGSEKMGTDIAPECLEASYDLGIVVAGHIYATATPVVPDTTSCPILVFDATWNIDADTGEPVGEARKNVRAIYNEGAQAELNAVRYLLDMTVSLDDLAHAYDVAEVQDIPEQGYDIIVNNCAGFVIDFFSHLDIDVTDDEGMIQYTVDELMLTADYIMNLVRNSENIDLLNLDTPAGVHDGSIPDREVVDALVRNYVENN